MNCYRGPDWIRFDTYDLSNHFCWPLSEWGYIADLFWLTVKCLIKLSPYVSKLLQKSTCGSRTARFSVGDCCFAVRFEIVVNLVFDKKV